MGIMRRRRRTQPEKPDEPVEPRKHRFEPRWIPPGRTPEEQERAIEEAIEFIVAKQREHKMLLSWEIGEFLFANVYGGDIAYLGLRDPGKDDSLHDIAQLSGAPYSSLYAWTRAAVVRRLLASRGVESGLEPTLLADLGALGGDLDALAALARWAEDNDLTREELLDLVRSWKRRLARGESLEKLVRSLGRRGKKKKGSPRRRRRLPAEDDRVVRVLGLILAWARIAELSPAKRKELGKILADVRACVGRARKAA
jgi:hypothetical protein